MGGLSGESIVAVWEAAREQRPLDRALTLLALASPTRSRDELARLSIGERDRQLYELRERTFGSRLPLTASCPACREDSEFEVALRDLVQQPAVGPFSVENGEETIRFRLPDSTDLSHALASSDPRRALAERCVVDRSQPLDATELAVLAKAIEACDPQAEVRFALACAACGHQWKAVLDIGELLFSEVGASARDLLGQVHALAYAYKWREADILQMSAARRRLYLQMVGYE